MLARCTSSLDLHMLIVPLWYLFRTLLVPKVALGYIALAVIIARAAVENVAMVHFVLYLDDTQLKSVD